MALQITLFGATPGGRLGDRVADQVGRQCARCSGRGVVTQRSEERPVWDDDRIRPPFRSSYGVMRCPVGRRGTEVCGVDDNVIAVVYIRHGYYNGARGHRPRQLPGLYRRAAAAR